MLNISKNYNKYAKKGHQAFRICDQTNEETIRFKKRVVL